MSSEQDKKSESKSMINLPRELRACELTDRWLQNYNFCLKEKRYD
jgi:hypothetical protein